MMWCCVENYSLSIQSRDSGITVQERCASTSYLLRGKARVFVVDTGFCRVHHQVMEHPWFEGMDWELLEAKETRVSEIAVPYNPQTDFVVDTAPAAASLVADLSSAESIDPEDDAKYFADF